jgi:hypothetical protein
VTRGSTDCCGVMDVMKAHLGGVIGAFFGGGGGGDGSAPRKLVLRASLLLGIAMQGRF